MDNALRVRIPVEVTFSRTISMLSTTQLKQSPVMGHIKMT